MDCGGKTFRPDGPPAFVREGVVICLFCVHLLVRLCKTGIWIWVFCLQAVTIRDMELTGKTALVTGASGKVGRVLVPALAREGVRCVCHSCRGGEEMKRFLTPFFSGEEARGLAPLFVQADFCEAGGVERLFEAVDEIGRAEILIQLAGTFERGRLTTLTDAAIQEQIEINLMAPMRAAREFAWRVGQWDDGSGPGPVAKIINFTDIAAQRPWAEYSAYCTAKAGLTAFTQALAKELAPRVLVNAVAPGVLEEGEPHGQSPSYDAAQREREIRRIPAGRLGRIEEVAEAVLFLLKNDYVNGQVLAVDGGRSV